MSKDRLTKRIEMTDELAGYVEDLHAKAEDKDFLSELDKTWDKEHHFLQIPLSEAKFLSLFVKALKPKKVLEIGTFRGWSAAWIARSLQGEARLLTIDHDARIEAEARELWEKLGLQDRIEMRRDKALPVLNELKERGDKFDLIFIDARKTEYKDYLDLSYGLLNDGGVILADNILWAGHTADDDTTEGRAKYLKEFNEYVFEKFAGSACLVPAWDGVVMVVK